MLQHTHWPSLSPCNGCVGGPAPFRAVLHIAAATSLLDLQPCRSLVEMPVATGEKHPVMPLRIAPEQMIFDEPQAMLRAT